MSDEKPLVERELTSPAIHEPGDILSLVGRMASDPSISVDKIERLMAMHDAMIARENERLFHEAMSQARSKMERIEKTRWNPQTKSWYADIGDVNAVIAPIYTSCGISITFNHGRPENNEMEITATVSACGHNEKHSYWSPITTTGFKGGAMMTEQHARAAAIKYGRRYLLESIFNLGAGDKDGNTEIERITAEQAADIRALLEEVGGDEQAFLRWIKADSIEGIAAQAYNDCIRALEKKRK